MTRTLLLLSALTLAACGQADAPNETPAPQAEAITVPSDNLWTINYADSALRFSGTQEDVKFTGEFERFTAQVSFDPDAPETGAILVVVETGSAQSGDDERDSALPGRDWFDTKSFPVATFSSQDIRKVEGGNSYLAEGELEIKGTTQPVRLPFSLEIDGNTALATGRVELDRSEFDVGSGNYATDQWIAYPVEVTFTLSAAREG
jgi:polyisoprenoid-binding protein YceI